MEFYLKSANQGNKDAKKNYSIFFSPLNLSLIFFSFSLMIGMLQDIISTLKQTNVEDWTMNDVINWMSFLNLSQR
jgi:ABC-type antimicrobial peptide transport system permease subunit